MKRLTLVLIVVAFACASDGKVSRVVLMPCVSPPLTRAECGARVSHAVSSGIYDQSVDYDWDGFITVLDSGFCKAPALPTYNEMNHRPTCPALSRSECSVRVVAALGGLSTRDSSIDFNGDGTISVLDSGQCRTLP